MASLNFDVIYSRFLSKVQAYDFLDLSEYQINSFMYDWLKSSVSKPYIRRLFSSILIDAETQSLAYEMTYSVDDSSDQDFIIEVLAIGMIIEWLEPKINSILNISQMFGSKEEKFYSQSAHLGELMSLRDTLCKKQRRMVTDRGYIWNSYLDGE